MNNTFILGAIISGIIFILYIERIKRISNLCSFIHVLYMITIWSIINPSLCVFMYVLKNYLFNFCNLKLENNMIINVLLVIAVSIICFECIFVIYKYLLSFLPLPNSGSRPVKGILLVRTDLNMSTGKIVAQAMHSAYQAGTKANECPIFSSWAASGFKKVSLRVKTEEEMKNLCESLKNNGIPLYPIIDAGRTQIPSSTWTVTFAGPHYEDEIDKITGHLKLL